MTESVRADCATTLLTPAGRGAVAVMAVWGTQAACLMESLFRPDPRGDSPRPRSERCDSDSGRMWVNHPKK